ncbi:MAG: hypothetical protein GTO18_16370 [Anaerolineales bacterium]|nr:hypothetical protein [Anaerolineales bacterium]
MTRPPISMYWITLTGGLLGIWMTLEGLYYRLFEAFRDPDALWLNWAETLKLDPNRLAWLLIVIGTLWIGALCALWLRLGFGYWLSVILAVFSLGFAIGGTVLAFLAIIGLALPTTRRWVNYDDASDSG